MKIARGGWSHILVGLVLLAAGGFFFYKENVIAGALLLIAGVLVTAFMVYFFRDPERVSPTDEGIIVSGADGWVRSVEEIAESRYLNIDTIRVSTYLTPWDVHVNRVPLAGKVVGLNYTPGKHILTRNPKSSEVNEHSTILIKNESMTYMVRQIVGPLVRRVVYWLKDDQDLAIGDRLGIMKFGSRLDAYFPADSVTPLVKAGDRVYAGITPIAQIRKNSS